jgi:glycosyltransferase involved in cell wall biosynthesis
MAVGADAVAVDAAQMRGPGQNAAIWYAQDGFDPKAKGINGRRVAGESFLKGFLRHTDAEEFVLLSKGADDVAPVRALAEQLRPGKPLRHVPLMRPATMAPVPNLFFPSPNYAAESWRRAAYGTGAWSICGITHTTSTAAVMQGFFDLRMAPVMPWDAVICTSRAVLGSVTHQMDLIDLHMRSHLLATPPPRPMLPVIPLGIHCDDFIPDPAAGAALRARLGAEPRDVVFTTIARLTPHEKFDPLPIYLAMQAAQRQLPGQKLHIAFCGLFRDDFSRKVFEQGALRLMPDVGFVLLDGANADERKAVLSGADVFLFLIDNIQETFGLAPIEGMAAGLPLLVSDWDGMKDTVTPDVGFRITSRSLPPQHLAQEALRYQGGIDSYVQYCASTSAMTEIDMPELTARILELARNPNLRRKLGQAGAERARAVYDWAQIIPQMQDLWGEQDALRTASSAQSRRYAAEGLPVAPSPTALFGGYPTQQVGFATTRFTAVDLTGRATLAEVLTVRNYHGVKRMFAAPEHIAAVLGAVTAQAGVGLAELESATSLRGPNIERVLIWLLKYDFVRRCQTA